MESAPDFLIDIIDDLSPDWTVDTLQHAINQANLTTDQVQELTEFLNVEAGDDPTKALTGLMEIIMSGGELLGVLNSTSKCLQPTITVNDWLEYSIGPVIFVILIFAFLQQRRQLCPRFWNGRPGIAYPVNLVDAYDFRVAFTCAFCTCIVSIMELFKGEWHIDPDLSALPSMVQGTVEFIIFILNVLEICFIYYPLFVCLTTSYVFLGQIIGFLFTASWIFLYTLKLRECPIFSSERTATLEVSTLTSITILPIYACLWYLLLRFFLGILFCCYKCYKSKHTTAILYISPPKKFTHTHYYARIQYLLTTPSFEKQTGLAKLKNWCYQTAPGFKFSRRFVITIGVSALALYEVSLMYMFSIDKILSALSHLFANDGPLKEGFEITNTTEIFGIVHRSVYAAKDTFWITCYVSLGIMVSFLVHMIFVYRDNTIRLWRGDRTICPPEELSFATLIVANLRYSGYQIAYCVWGFVLIQAVLWVIVMLIIVVLVHPFMGGRSNYFTEFLEDYWLTFVVGYAFYYLQVLVSKIFFLQKRGNILSLNNRRLFHVTTFVLFFLNVSIGLVSCLMRIIKAVIFGLLYIGRMDRCILMRGWELWDTGYRSYLGFLLLEVAHTHPVMISFCHILQEHSQKHRSNERYIIETEEADVTDSPPVSSNKVARNRWHVAVFLLRNPSLRKFRSPKVHDDEKMAHSDTAAEEAREIDGNLTEDNKPTHTDVEQDTTSVASSHGNSSHHSTSLGSIAHIAREALLESNPVHLV